MSTDRPRHVVVIGAGVIGAGVAHRLAEAGVTVTVVDAVKPEQGLSAHSFGWVNPVDSGHDGYYRLTLEALEAHRRLAAEIAAPRWYFPVGNLQWTQSQSDQLALDETAAGYRRRGYPVVELGRAELLALEPSLALPAGLDRAISYPCDGYVLGDRLISAALDRAAALGAEVVTEDPVVGFVADETARGVRLSSGRVLSADQLVCCVGRNINALLSLLGARLPVVEPDDSSRLTRGLLVRTAPVRHSVTRVVHAPGLSIRPHPGGRLVLHCHDLDQRLTGDDDPDALAAEVLQRLHQIVPQGRGTEVGIESSYLGVRPMPRDGMSMLGWLPDQRGLYVVLTHSGVTLGPVLAEIVAQEVLGTPHPLAAQFRPDRLVTV